MSWQNIGGRRVNSEHLALVFVSGGETNKYVSVWSPTTRLVQLGPLDGQSAADAVVEAVVRGDSPIDAPLYEP